MELLGHQSDCGYRVCRIGLALEFRKRLVNSPRQSHLIRSSRSWRFLDAWLRVTSRNRLEFASALYRRDCVISSIVQLVASLRALCSSGHRVPALFSGLFCYLYRVHLVCRARLKGLSVFNFHHSHPFRFRAYKSDVAMLTPGSFLSWVLSNPLMSSRRVHVHSLFCSTKQILKREDGKITVISSYPVPAWEGV